MLISDQLKANKTAYAEYLLQLVIQADAEYAEYWTEMGIKEGPEKAMTAVYVQEMAHNELDDLETTSWSEGVYSYTGNYPMDFRAWMREEGRIPTPPLPQEPLHFRILYNPDNEGWNWTCEEEAEHPGGNFITSIVQARHLVEFVAYASTDAEADYMPVTIDWDSEYGDSDVLVLTGVPQILEGVRYSDVFALMDADHYASLKGQVPIPA